MDMLIIFRNGVTCLTLAKIIKKIIDEKSYWRGVQHIFSPYTVSKYELCKIVSNIYGANVTVHPVEAKENKNMSLTSSRKMFDIPPIQKQIEEQKDFSALEFFR